jgi:glycosyltransferase involved in cell wall biosynthesis
MQTRRPTVTVIVPCYNLEAYISECVEGLCLQDTSFPFEVIVCDDGSTDRSLEVLRRLSRRFACLRVLSNERNLGLVGTMKRLFEEARGDLIAYMDGDDVALPGKIEALAGALMADSSVSIAYHEVEVFDSATGEVKSLYCRDFYNAKYLGEYCDPKDLLLYGIFLQASAVMFRRHRRMHEVLEHPCKIICDYPFHLGNAYSLGGKIRRIDSVLGRYRLHASSFGALTLKSIDRRMQVTKDLIAAAEYSATFGARRLDIERSKVHSYFAASLYYLKAGDESRFIKSIELAEMISVMIDWRFDERQEILFNRRFSFEYLINDIKSDKLNV